MNIEKTCKELTKYITNEIINGNFKFKDVDFYTARVIVQEKYEIHVWLANGIDYCRLYNLGGLLDEFCITHRKRELYNTVKPLADKYKKEVTLKQKRAELINLEKELSILQEHQQ